MERPQKRLEGDLGAVPLRLRNSLSCDRVLIDVQAFGLRVLDGSSAITMTVLDGLRLSLYRRQSIESIRLPKLCVTCALHSLSDTRHRSGFEKHRWLAIAALDTGGLVLELYFYQVHTPLNKVCSGFLTVFYDGYTDMNASGCHILLQMRHPVYVSIVERDHITNTYEYASVMYYAEISIAPLQLIIEEHYGFPRPLRSFQPHDVCVACIGRLNTLLKPSGITNTSNPCLVCFQSRREHRLEVLWRHVCHHRPCHPIP